MDSTQIINLLNQDISIVDLEGKEIASFKPDEKNRKLLEHLSRSKQVPVQKDPIAGCRVIENSYELSEEFPAEDPNIYYIVPEQVLTIFKSKRSDFLVPGNSAAAFGIQGKNKYLNFKR